MVATNQNGAVARVLAHEGGNVDDPQDPGGRTSRGVTQRVYDAWRKGRGQACLDVFRMAPAEARAIYIEQYWNRVRGDELPAGVDYAVFDAAVNSGPVQAVKWLQRALGGVRVDGVVGQVTLRAAQAHPDKARLIADMCARRMAFLRQLRTWRRFGGGWTRRVTEVERAALGLVAGRKVASAASAKGGGARAEPAQMRAARGAGAAQAMAGAGIATAAAAEAIGQNLREAAAEIGAASQHLATLNWLASWLTVAGAVALAGGICWRICVAWRARAIAAARDDEPSGDAQRGPWSWLGLAGVR